MNGNYKSELISLIQREKLCKIRDKGVCVFYGSSGLLSVGLPIN